MSETGSCTYDVCDRAVSGEDYCYWHRKEARKEPFSHDPSGTEVPDDLTGAHLPGADLTGLAFRNLNVSDAELRYSDLTTPTLRNVTLRDVDLTGADLTDASLGNADLTGAALEGAEFTDASLRGVNLSGCYLREADFREADLEEAKFHRANLQETELSRADCENAEFDQAVLNRASLEAADLVGARFPEAYLFGTRFTGAQIDSRTQFGSDGPVGDLSTPNCCRHGRSRTSNAVTDTIIQTEDEVADKRQAMEVVRARRARGTYRQPDELARQNGFPDASPKCSSAGKTHAVNRCSPKANG